MRKQVEMLKYHSHFLTVHINVRLRIHQIFPRKNDTSVRRIFQTIQTAKKCTFTGTGRSDHTDNLAFFDVGADTVQCMYATAESLGQVLNLDQGLFFLNAHCYAASSLKWIPAFQRKAP